jgi:hypothetical protein
MAETTFTVGSDTAKPAMYLSEGFHNAHPEQTGSRIHTGSGYRNCSTVCVVATRGTIPTRAVQNWMGMMPMMNQPYFRLFVEKMEVANAYNQALEIIQGNEGLKDFTFMLTLEEDNLPPPDGFHKLISAMWQDGVPEDKKIKNLAAVSGLYWTKGEGGQPMIYGNPYEVPGTFAPQPVQWETLQECRGIAMGFALWDMKLFRDERLKLPGGGFFQTVNKYTEGQGCASGTQDLEFCQRALTAGYRFAVDTRIKVGHLNVADGQVW